MRALTILILLMATAGLGLLAWPKAPSKERTSEPAVAKNEAINQNLIEENLTPAEEEVFANEDISDEADETISTGLKTLPAPRKKLELYNVNTEESIEVVFWADGEYLPRAVNNLDEFMRDWRRNTVVEIDRDLYMLLYDLYEDVDASKPIHLISGHRSKKTNDALRAMGRKTARKSQHVLGRAADITIPGVPVRELRESALEMERGGVGYYPKSNFVHVDTGRVRQW